jgi:hypothetical protein
LVICSSRAGLAVPRIDWLMASFSPASAAVAALLYELTTFF